MPLYERLKSELDRINNLTERTENDDKIDSDKKFLSLGLLKSKQEKLNQIIADIEKLAGLTEYQEKKALEEKTTKPPEKKSWWKRLKADFMSLDEDMQGQSEEAKESAEERVEEIVKNNSGVNPEPEKSQAEDELGKVATEIDRNQQATQQELEREAELTPQDKGEKMENEMKELVTKYIDRYKGCIIEQQNLGELSQGELDKLNEDLARLKDLQEQVQQGIYYSVYKIENDRTCMSDSLETFLCTTSSDISDEIDKIETEIGHLENDYRVGKISLVDKDVKIEELMRFKKELEQELVDINKIFKALGDDYLRDRFARLHRERLTQLFKNESGDEKNFDNKEPALDEKNKKEPISDPTPTPEPESQPQPQPEPELVSPQPSSFKEPSQAPETNKEKELELTIENLTNLVDRIDNDELDLESRKQYVKLIQKLRVLKVEVAAGDGDVENLKKLIEASQVNRLLKKVIADIKKIELKKQKLSKGKTFEDTCKTVGSIFVG
jgi:hypothetical protein